MRKLLWMTALVALGCGTPADDDRDQDGPGAPPAVPVGKPAPAFAPDFAVNGEVASLADLRGKVVLLDFWAVWCGPCRAVFPELTKLHETYHDQGLEVVGLTQYYGRYDFKGGKLEMIRDRSKALSRDDERLMLSSFVEHHKLPYRIQTVSQADMDAYRIESIPVAVLIDRQGVVRMTRVGARPEGLKALEARIKKLLKE